MTRRFQKRWNTLCEEFVFKDLETREILTREDFFMEKLKSDEDIKVINPDEPEPDGTPDSQWHMY